MVVLAVKAECFHATENEEIATFTMQCRILPWLVVRATLFPILLPNCESSHLCGDSAMPLAQRTEFARKRCDWRMAMTGNWKLSYPVACKAAVKRSPANTKIRRCLRAFRATVHILARA